MSSARYSNRAMRYYDPGRNPQPRPIEFTVRSGTRKKNRVPKAQRLELMRQAGIERPSGRQWKRLRARLRREAAR